MDIESTQLNEICYDNVFLKDVIIRVDFISPIEQLKKQLPKALSSEVLKYYPISEPKKTIAKGFEFSVQGAVKSLADMESMVWNFYGKEREKILRIDSQALTINYKKYNKYHFLRDEFFNIVSTFFDVFPEAQGSRIGLRYINEITLEDENVFDWSKYINDNLLGVFNFYDNKSNYARLLNNIEFNFDDFILKFHFGMHNPDYPSKIVKKVFILDYDAFHQGLMDRTLIQNCVDKFHSKIQNLFEMSIKSDLREILNGKK